MLRQRVIGKIISASRMRLVLKRWGDAPYLRLLYGLRMGRRLNLKDPQRFSEKIQWLKLHDRNPLYTQLVDKHAVKQWVASRIGERHVIPCLGVWESFDEIDLAALPEQFVLKCTHDSGGLVICDNPATFDPQQARRKITRALKRNYFYSGREWPYKDVRPQVLAEVYFPSWTPAEPVSQAFPPYSTPAATPADQSKDGVLDYKFYCFHGEPQFLSVSQGLHGHGSARVDFVTLDWNLASFSRPDYRRFSALPPPPAGLAQMVEFARTLAEGIPFVRVDFFEHRGHVLFSEMTFHPMSGMRPFSPQTADREIGDLLDLSLVEARV